MCPFLANGIGWLMEASQEQMSALFSLMGPNSSFQSTSEIFYSTLQLGHAPSTHCMSLFGLLAYHIMGTALLSNDPDNDRLGVYLALVSLTDLLTFVAGRESRKQSWQSLGKHVMAALWGTKPWGPERGGGITWTAAPHEVYRHHHHRLRLVVHLRALTDRKVLRKTREGSISSLRDTGEDCWWCFSSDPNQYGRMRRCFPRGEIKG